MPTYSFTFTLYRELTDEEVDQMFEEFAGLVPRDRPAFGHPPVLGDATYAIQGGVPQLLCAVEAETMDEAVIGAVWNCRRAGFTPKEIEMDPAVVAPQQ